MELNLRKYLLGFIPSIVVVFLILILYNFFRYPLSNQDIYEKMSSKNIVNHKKEQGVGVFVVGSDNSFTSYIFVESALINRYRLYLQHEHNSTFVTAVPGKRNYFALEAGEEYILLHIGQFRYGIDRVIIFLSVTILLNNVIYPISGWLKSGKLRKRKCSEDFEDQRVV